MVKVGESETIKQVRAKCSSFFLSFQMDYWLLSRVVIKVSILSYKKGGNGGGKRDTNGQ
jgi:hypothetical protein